MKQHKMIKKIESTRKKNKGKYAYISMKYTFQVASMTYILDDGLAEYGISR